MFIFIMFELQNNEYKLIKLSVHIFQLIYNIIYNLTGTLSHPLQVQLLRCLADS